MRAETEQSKVSQGRQASGRGWSSLFKRLLVPLLRYGDIGGSGNATFTLPGEGGMGPGGIGAAEEKGEREIIMNGSLPMLPMPPLLLMNHHSLLYIACSHSQTGTASRRPFLGIVGWDAVWGGLWSK